MRASTLSILPFLIAHESWTWLEPANYCFCKAQRNTSLGVFFFFLITQELNKKLSGHSEAACIVRLLLDCRELALWTMQYLKETQHSELFRTCGAWDLCQGTLWKMGAFFCRSEPDKHIAVWWCGGFCSPASIGFTILLQWCLPSTLVLSAFFSCFGPTSVKCTVRLWSVVVHSFVVSNASSWVLSSHDSGSPGQCLFLHQADGKYLVSLIYLKPAKQES